MQLFFPAYVDDLNMADTSTKHAEDVGTLHKKVDLDDAVSFLDQVHLGCTQRTAQVNTRIVMERQKLFSKLISTYAGCEEKIPRDITAWSCDIVDVGDHEAAAEAPGHDEALLEVFGRATVLRLEVRLPRVARRAGHLD